MMLHGLRRWWSVERKRPNIWRKAASDWKKSNPLCAICNGTDDIEAHDVRPYHVIPNPESKTRDFWYGNFITLCYHDHRSIGHCADPKCDRYNPRIRDIASAVGNFRASCTS
jgi:hypothetical protein